MYIGNDMYILYYIARARALGGRGRVVDLSELAGGDWDALTMRRASDDICRLGIHGLDPVSDGSKHSSRIDGAPGTQDPGET
jgi:hypothetical protein